MDRFPVVVPAGFDLLRTGQNTDLDSPTSPLQRNSDHDTTLARQHLSFSLNRLTGDQMHILTLESGVLTACATHLRQSPLLITIAGFTTVHTGARAL